MRITESQEAEIRRAIQSTMNAILKWYNITTCSYSMDCLRGVNSSEQIGYKVKIRLTTHIKEDSILKWKSVLKATEYSLELEHNYIHIVFSVPFANYVEKKKTQTINKSDSMCNQNTTSTPPAKSNFEEEVTKLGELAKLKEYAKETAELIKESYYATIESYLVFESTNLTTHEIDGWYVSIRVKAKKLTPTVNESSVPGTYIENWRALFGAERWFVSSCEDNLDITFLVKPQKQPNYG